MANCTEQGIKNSCIECDVPQMARNHYFTGKLMVKRDFTDEQRYHMGKQRRHNRRLHGWGTVCGLKVKEHPNEACRNQYVVIEPGMAIDCCGREILVPREEYFDFRTRFLEHWREQHPDAGEDEGPGSESPTLQLCVRYLECPTEDVPAPFDECGCDNTACQPNRIQESYEFDVLIDPDTEAEDFTGVRLDWRCTVNVANTHRVALDAVNERLFVLTSDDPATLYVFRTDNHSLIASHGLGARAMDLALSPDGNRAYVAIDRARGVVVVLDTSPPGTSITEDHRLNVNGTAGADILLAAASTGRLYVMKTEDDVRKIVAWDETDNGDPIGNVEVGVGSGGMVISPDGSLVFVANSDDGNISVINAASDSIELREEPITVEGTFNPYALAVADTTDGPRLYVADNVANTIYIFDAADPFAPKGGPQSLNMNTPVDLVVSPGSRWLYVLVEDEDEDSKGHIQVVDTHRVETGEVGEAVGSSIPVGDAPRELVLAAAARRLYAAYNGSDIEGDGGVAVIAALEKACADLFERVLEPCPECPDRKCVVLATISNYVYDDRLLDQPPTGDEPGNGQAYIDNFQGRHLLPSTDLITEVVQCILERGVGVGERGEQGPPGHPGESGEPGRDGLGIDAVTVTILECTEENGFALINTTHRGRTLELGIPRGCDAETPEAMELTHICGINWEHGINHGQSLLDTIFEEGLLIAFNQEVEAEFINDRTFHVFVLDQVHGEHPFKHWRELEGEYVGGAKLTRISDDGVCTIEGYDNEPSGLVNGARFYPNPPARDQIVRIFNEFKEVMLRVVLKGDLISDGKAGVDANHLPPWLPNRPTGDGVEGGTFESWFSIMQGRPD